jgi:hypothetical protein
MSAADKGQNDSGRKKSRYFEILEKIMNMHFRVSLMIRGGVGVMALLVGTFFAAQVQAACTAANPNASVVEDTPTADFTDNGDGTVTHTLTGLMWKQCAEGLSGAGCATGTATMMNWSSALSVAASGTTAGYSDWRLPNQGELLSIVETCGYTPAINQTLFPITPLSAHWSASSYVLSPASAWGVGFSDGYVSYFPKGNAMYVLLVRGGQSLDTFDTLAPRLTAVAVSATGATDTTLAATSNVGATGYWLVAAQGSAAPTAAEVKAGVDYGAVTVTASGMASMVAGVEKSFSVSGLTAGTAYDLYVVGYDDNNKALTYSLSKVAFTTAHDTTPDAFGFTDQTGVALSTTITSSTITVSGITTGVDISVIGGEYAINGGAYVVTAGSVNNGDTVTVRHTSAATNNSVVETVLTIGGVSDTFSSTSGSGGGGALGLWFLVSLLGTALLRRRRI